MDNSLATQVTTMIGSAFTDMQAVGVAVLTLAVPVMVGLSALGGGINFAIKKIKGVLSKAS